MQEALRDLRELRALRNREAAALRDSLAMVDLLRSTGGATTQADVLTALLAAVLRHSGADGVVIAGLDDGVPRTYQAVGSANRDLRLPAALFAEPEATILADLHLGSWAKPLTDSARAFHAVMRAPLALPGVTGGCVIALSKQAEAYGSEDLDFLVKLADVARQALSRVALVEHNAILAAVIDGAEASITIADARDHSLPLIYVNQAFCRLSGYEPEEVLGRNCRFLSVEPKDSPERTRLRQVIRDFDTGTFVLRNQRKNGDLFWNRLTIYPVYGQTRKIDYLVASQSDVTAERDAQDQRDQAKANLATALSSTNQGFLLLDPDGLIIFANSRFRRFFETEQASWTSGQPYREVYQRRLRDTGLSAQDAAAIAEKRFRTMYSMPTVREMVLGDGRVLMVNDQPTDNGGAVTVVTDVTNLKVAERKLEERAAAIDAAQDGIAITDDAGLFTYMNSSHLAMFGFAEEKAILGRPWSDLYRPEQADYLRKAAFPQLERSGTWRGEVVGKTADGQPVHQEISLTRMPHIGLICVTRDVSDKRRIEAEQSKLRDQLQTAKRQEAIGRLAAEVAHDFNNLISVVAGSATLLQADLEPEHPSQKQVSRILSAGQRAMELVNRILDFGKRAMDIRDVDLTLPLKEAAELVRSALPDTIALDMRLPDDPCIIPTDHGRIVQIVTNLCLNARDAITVSTGSIRVTLDQVTLPQDHPAPAIGKLQAGQDYAKIAVRDSGSGMSEADQQKIFEAYYSTKGATGTGLGLAIVSSEVTAARGAICVSSEPGRGSTFEIYLPMVRPAPRASEVAAIGKQKQPPGKRALTGTTILVCDDVEEVAEIIATLLTKAGAETAICTHPEDALEAILDSPEDWSALITDFDMPEMSGEDLAWRIRNQVDGFPIILCSAFSHDHPQGQPFDGHLTKPVNSERLIRTCLDAIQLHKK